MDASRLPVYLLSETRTHTLKLHTKATTKCLIASSGYQACNKNTETVQKLQRFNLLKVLSKSFRTRRPKTHLRKLKTRICVSSFPLFSSFLMRLVYNNIYYSISSGATTDTNTVLPLPQSVHFSIYLPWSKVHRFIIHCCKVLKNI